MSRIVVDPAQNEISDSEEDAKKNAIKHADELLAKGRQQVIDHREGFKGFAFGVAQAWVGFLMVITFMQMALKPFGMTLDSEEFIAVFTSSTASVFGLAYLVGNYLFPKGGASFQEDGR
jgi:uncharacterized membrane protein YfcA